MNWHPTTPTILAPALALALACCSQDPVQPSASAAIDPVPRIAATGPTAVDPAAAAGAGAALPEFDPNDFVGT